jgi:hypothetical protein
MNLSGNGQGGPYSVSMSAKTRETLKVLHRQAIQNGTGHQFLSAFRRIVERLRNDPQVFGEPLYQLAALQLQIRQAVILPLVIEYAVHEQQPLVFIRVLKVLS